MSRTLVVNGEDRLSVSWSTVEVSHTVHAGMTKGGQVTAHPVYDSDPDDPVEILHALPEEHHARFQAEYAAAVDEARRPEQFHQLQELLRLWRLRAAAYASPGYAGRLADAREGSAAGFTPAGQVIPGWPGGHRSQ